MIKSYMASQRMGAEILVTLNSDKLWRTIAIVPNGHVIGTPRGVRIKRMYDSNE